MDKRFSKCVASGCGVWIDEATVAKNGQFCDVCDRKAANAVLARVAERNNPNKGQLRSEDYDEVRKKFFK